MAKSDDILKRAKLAIDQTNEARRMEVLRREQDHKLVMESLGSDILDVLTPLLEEIVANARISKEEMKEVISEIAIEAPKVDVPKAEVSVKMPDIPAPNVNVSVPEIKIPEIKAPKVTVNVPKAEAPVVNIPENKINFPESMTVSMSDVDNKRPLPVMMMDTKGRPLSFSMGASGGRSNFLTISDIRGSTASLIDDQETALRVTSVGGGSGLTDTELRAASIAVLQASDQIFSTNTVQLGGDTLAKGEELSAGFLRVLHATDVGLSTNLQVGGSDVSASNPVPSEPEGHGSVGDGILTVATPGVRVQFPSQAVKRVIISGLADNPDAITIGSGTVVGAEATRQGIGLFPTQAQEFFVTNLNLLFADSVSGSTKASYYYEN